MGGTCNIKEPDSLKACLQLFAKLSDSDVKSKVLEEIKSKIAEYCGFTYASNYAFVTSNLSLTLQHCHFLVRRILPSDTFGTYSSVHCGSSHEQCIQRIVTALTSKLSFQVFAALYYLYFKTSDECRDIKGGEWKEHRLDPNTSSTTKKELHDWLTSSGTNDRFIQRGFDSTELKSANSGVTVSTKVKSIVDRTYGGYLGSALVPLLFLGDWHESKLGHSLLFLREFCCWFSMVDENVSKPHLQKSNMIGLFETLKKVCIYLKSALNPFVNGISTMHAVCQSSARLYPTLWDPSKLDKYVRWFQQNFHNIVDALNGMKTDSTKWKDHLCNAEFCGPFLYGFVFKDDKWVEDIESKLQPAITTLTVSLSALLDALLQARTLKECLCLFAKLSTLERLRKKVLEKVRSKVRDYCDPMADYMTKIGQSSDSGYLYLTMWSTVELLAHIIGSKYCGKYSVIMDCESDGLTSWYCDKIIEHIPKIYSALYLLYFNTSGECKNMKGGGWNGQHIKGDGTNDLYKWLNDSSTSGYDSSILPRGFNGSDLMKSTQGFTIAIFLEHAVSHKEGGHIQTALCGMLFVCPWDNGLTGHAVCFICYFCGQVSADNDNKLALKFNGMKLTGEYSNFKTACKNLKDKLEKIVTGTDDVKIQAVCQVGTNIYENICGTMNEEKFSKHIDWIRENLGSLNESLTQMLKDSARWNESNLKDATSTGPFKYGFIFKDGWDKQSDGFKDKLQPTITTLTSSIDSFKEMFDQVKDKGDEGIGQSQFSSDDTSEVPCHSFKTPDTLKECLQFLAMHKICTTKSEVMGMIRDRVTMYCGQTHLDKFFQDNSSGDLYLTLFNADMLFALILGSNYRNRNCESLTYSYNCSMRYVDTITVIFPKLFSALYFLYFNTERSLENTIQGGGWKDMHLNGSGSGHLDVSNNNDLHTWLKGSDDEHTPGLIRGGFSDDDLKDSMFTGATISNAGVKYLVRHSYPGDLQRALVPMLFICPWNHALTGHACLFLKVFCDAVITTVGDDEVDAVQAEDEGEDDDEEDEEEEYSGLNFQSQLQQLKLPGSVEAFKNICSAISENLEPFTEATEVLSAVCQQGNTNLYEMLLKTNSFEHYLKWLLKNLQSIIASLKTMLTDCEHWDKGNLKNAGTAGPFKYGFVFNSWDGKPSSVEEKLSRQVSDLIHSLKALYDLFFPTSSLGAIIGGVTSGVAAVGAGAAYVFNIGGVATSVNGIIGAISGLAA